MKHRKRTKRKKTNRAISEKRGIQKIDKNSRVKKLLSRLTWEYLIKLFNKSLDLLILILKTLHFLSIIY